MFTKLVRNMLAFPCAKTTKLHLEMFLTNHVKMFVSGNAKTKKCIITKLVRNTETFTCAKKMELHISLLVTNHVNMFSARKGEAACLQYSHYLC